MTFDDIMNREVDTAYIKVTEEYDTRTMIKVGEVQRLTQEFR